MSRRIADTKVKEVMSSTVVTLTEETTIKQLKEAFDERDFNAFPVVEGERLVGIVTKLDLMRAFSLGLTPSKSRTHHLWASAVGDIMRTAVIWVKPEDTVQKAVEYMVEFKVRSLPVVEGGRLVGIVSRGDLMPYLLIEDE